MIRRVAPIAIALCVLASHVRADRVHLFGGNVIEGKATRSGDKVIVELESGQVVLPADSVQRIEAAESDVQRFEARYAKLRPGDVKGMMALADFCRDHDMRERERQLLLKVIEVSSDHAEARSRLGYVHTDAGWVTREEQMRAQGLVQHEGQWVTRQQLVEIERLQAEADIAAHERDKAQVELEQKRLELDKERASRDAAQADRTRVAQVAQVPPTTYYGPYPSYAGYGYAGYGYAGSLGPARCFGVHCSRAAPPPTWPPPRAPFPIPGVRDPFDYTR
jgi:hypothetical protein